ncbi:MAG TPA: hypothetical protein VGT03_10900 [Candidatus Acidoferrales bacterium]|nr:hypothetical protein [Candidatus Acidoferrales bacterium]
MKPENEPLKVSPAESVAMSAKPDLHDPQVVLSLLEADQVVAAKQRTRFGKRNLSLGTRILLWGLRIYVVAMLVIVLISVLRALHAAG